MKKYILIILAVLIMATILMAKSEMVITKDTNTDVYTEKIDNNIVYKTTKKEDLEKIKITINPYAYKFVREFWYWDEEHGHLIHGVICEESFQENDCAKRAVELL